MRPQSHRAAARIVLAIVLAVAAACSSAPSRRPARSAPPPAARWIEPPPVRECPAPPASRSGEAAGPPPAGKERAGDAPTGDPRVPVPDRIVRVLAAGPVGTIQVEGCAVRAWRADGSLLAEWRGGLALSADGNRVRAGESRAEGSVDVGSDEPFRIAGRKFHPGRVRILARQGKLLAVAPLPLEEYVAAVVSREGAPSFRPAALAALAVAVRTYAVNAAENPRDPAYDLLNGVGDQVFEGFDRVHPQFLQAAEETRGVLLRYGDAPARANYHSTCGGRTASALEAWGKAVPYLESVECEDCRESPAWRWEHRMSAEEGRRLAESLGVRARGDLDFEVVSRSATGRAVRIRVASGRATREVAAAAFRQGAGTTRVKSLKLEIARHGDGWRFTGEGYGHGVGMCQWGAEGMARRGADFREILARYYPGTRLAGGET